MIAWLTYIYCGMKFEFTDDGILVTDIRHLGQEIVYRIRINFNYDRTSPFTIELLSIKNV